MTVIKTAMVLAAGIGSRMRPLTNDRPKALVEVGGKALIDHVLDRLAAAGVETAVVNIHHFADQMTAHLAHRSHPTIKIVDESGATLPRDLTVMAVRAEEMCWFPAFYLGSRAAFGLIPAHLPDEVRRSDSGRTCRAR